MPDVAGEHAVEVAAQAHECLAVLLDMERYPEWYDTLDLVRVLDRTGDGRPALARFEAAAGPLGTLELTLRVYWTPDRLVAEQIAGRGIDGVRMEWELEQLDGGRTRIAYRFVASARGFAARAALRAARRLVERDLVRAPAEHLKQRLES